MKDWTELNVEMWSQIVKKKFCIQLWITLKKIQLKITKNIKLSTSFGGF